jgi:cAMP phosphodiesterase
MEVRILASTMDAPNTAYYATAFVINQTVAVDAGPLGLCGVPETQARIRHVFLTHSHADHTATLPIMVENSFDLSQPAVSVHGHPATIEAVRRHIFNDVMWPDFIRLSRPERPFLKLHEIEAEQPVTVEDLTILPVMVNHIVPTFGYIVTDGQSTAIFGGDSGPTERIWEVAHRAQSPRTVFIECSFPNSMPEFACLTGHLTPALLAREQQKMPPMERLIAVHIKQKFREAILRDLADLRMEGLEAGRGGVVYHV